MLLEKQLYVGKAGEDEGMVSDSRGHAAEIQRANINIECAGSLSGAVSSFTSTSCSVRDASDSCYLLAGPKNQPSFLKALPQNSWSGDPNVGPRPPDGVAEISTSPSLRLSSFA